MSDESAESGTVDPHTAACENCGNELITTPGMDSIVEVTYRDTTEQSKEYFCDGVCLSEAVTKDV